MRMKVLASVVAVVPVVLGSVVVTGVSVVVELVGVAVGSAAVVVAGGVVAVVSSVVVSKEGGMGPQARRADIVSVEIGRMGHSGMAQRSS
ncbi:hypothetical protein [Nannocystis sp.]|uniref:hypothetical protein n=1 Tax=Nannocystis sp. TaxID=1962667 RepID=UPI0025D550D3|nr:hypothetical protein [Nannocystis sp.]MBK7825641.1 hypothetical protein [Nannocystis sp.]